ncbi:hypothetical protein [Butyrivibrio sp. M55]|uniref:hypothetical protein n=1 Tax=Butyrivibrio sp. M55 TaxID=1855323 RepID=UPI0008F40855|nr:hypothetical protein [Butyrivibrio sp. M55]SFU47675.1 Peptidase family M13 [Butyrivibrio sp. M55]
MKKRIQGIAVGMTIASALVFSFYRADVQAKEVDAGTKNGAQTKASTEIRPQDDYYGYINAKTLREADIDPKYGFGSFDECRMITEHKLYGIIDEITGERVHTSPDAEIIADYYDQIVSYDAAASDADKDFEAVRKEIEGISNKQEYMEVLGKYKSYTE